MDRMQMIPLSSDFMIEVEDRQKAKLPETILAAVEAIWQREIEELKHHVFNGRLLSLLELNEHRMAGEFVEYKHYLAQMRDQSLRSILGIKPVGVSAVTFAKGFVLVGKRSQNVFLDRGKYEFVPSGGIDPSSCDGKTIDLAKQFHIELEEEAGLSKAHILELKPLAIIIDQELGTHEACYALHLGAGALKIPLKSNPEYDELFWVKKEDLPLFIKKHESDVIVVSRMLFDAFLSQ